jgi:hypothetical protein
LNSGSIFSESFCRTRQDLVTRANQFAIGLMSGDSLAPCAQSPPPAFDGLWSYFFNASLSVSLTPPTAF